MCKNEGFLSIYGGFKLPKTYGIIVQQSLPSCLKVRVNVDLKLVPLFSIPNYLGFIVDYSIFFISLSN